MEALMALWRDPLDDLIGELERSLPSDYGAGHPSADFMDLQVVMDVILYGGKEQQRLLKSMPEHERMTRRFKRMGLSV
jgi:hypothetical protein